MKTSHQPPRAYSALIVDDQEAMREVLSRFLTYLGYTVAGTARDGREAVELAVSLKPDCILLDVAMPIMDGLEAAGLILAERWLPILICTGLDKDEVIREAGDLEISAFLSKPVGIETLTAAIENGRREASERSLRSEVSGCAEVPVFSARQ